MNTTILPGTEVATFAAAVRAALADLPPEDRDELLDGLEADLAERAAEGDADLGDAAAYAEELRAAAGYPPRSASSHLGGTLPDLRLLSRSLRRRWDALAARPAVAAVLAFLVTLRPVWWVFRGLAAYALLVSAIGASMYGASWWPIAIVAVVLSVQVGRGRMQRQAWARWLQRAVSAIVIVAAPFLLGGLATNVNLALSGGYGYDYGTTYYPQSLNRDGVPIDNIFAYDAEGNPIDRVQLFDQNGEPLNVVPQGDVSSDFWGAQDGSMLVPSGDVPGRAGWNVFPLAHVNDWSDYEDDGRIDETEVSATVFPVDHVKPLAGVPAGPAVPEQMTEPATPPAG